MKKGKPGKAMGFIAEFEKAAGVTFTTSEKKLLTDERNLQSLKYFPLKLSVSCARLPHGPFFTMCNAHFPLCRSIKAALVAEHNQVRVFGTDVTNVDHVIFMRRAMLDALDKLPESPADVPDTIKETHKQWCGRTNKPMADRTWANRIRLALLPDSLFDQFMLIVKLYDNYELKGMQRPKEPKDEDDGAKLQPMEISGLELLAVDRHALKAFMDALVSRSVAIRDYKTFHTQWKSRTGINHFFVCRKH